MPVTSLPGLQIEVLKAGGRHLQYAIEAYGIHTARFHTTTGEGIQWWSYDSNHRRRIIDRITWGYRIA